MSLESKRAQKAQAHEDWTMTIGGETKYYGGKHRASKVRAAIARAEFNDYRNRFYPLEDRRIAMVGNSALKQKQIGEAVGLTQQGFDTAEGIRADRVRSYGLQLTPEQQQAHDRKLGVERTAATVGAANTTRRAVDARDLSALGLSQDPAREEPQS